MTTVTEVFVPTAYFCWKKGLLLQWWVHPEAFESDAGFNALAWAGEWRIVPGDVGKSTES